MRSIQSDEMMEVHVVHWFKDVAWNDVALAAVACLSVTGVWATFWPGHRERLRKLRQVRLEHLRQVNRQLQHIGNWAAARPADLHDPHWYDASWGVRPFDWEDVERLNQVVIAGDFRRELTQALVQLELAADHFHRRLAEQIEFLRAAPPDIGLHWPAVVAAAEAKGSALTADELAQVPGLSKPDQAWLGTLYRRNKANHVEGIGGPGGAGLHEAWRLADTALVAERSWLQSGKETPWRWAGHITASLFAILGLLFLIDFTWSFIDARLHPPVAAPTNAELTPQPRSQPVQNLSQGRSTVGDSALRSSSSRRPAVGHHN